MVQDEATSYFFVVRPIRQSVTGSAASSNVNVKDQALRALAQLPPFSPILNRLIASLAQEDVSFAKISDLIEKDTVLAGNVLRLVNSALYGLRGTVNSIRHAVSLLGIAKLRNATLSMSVARMWSQVKTPPGWSMARFNLHSAGVAILADLLTQGQAVDYAEGAFAAGLFHDLGLLLVALGLPEEYKQIVLLHQQSPKWIIEYELQVLGMTHLELSAEALAIWNLPEPIQRAVRFTETPDLDPTVVGPDQIRLSRILNVTDRYVKGIGSSLNLFEGTPEDGQLALESLGLGERLPTVLSEFQTEFSTIQAYF
jgi:HD-like signal output (HDOD) protein